MLGVEVRTLRRLQKTLSGAVAAVSIGIFAASAAGLERPPPNTTPFDVKGKVTRIAVTASEEPPPVPAGSPMLAMLAGVLAEIPPNQMNTLRTAILQGATHVGPPPGAERWCVVHIVAEKEAKRIAIERTEDGSTYAALIDEAAEHPLRLELDREKAGELLRGWAMYRGRLEAGAGEAKPDEPVADDPGVAGGEGAGAEVEVFPLLEPGTAGALAPPIVPGIFALDRKVMTSRISGAPWAHEGMSRELKSESFGLRVPRGYSPKKPAGLLVWIDPGNKGGLPAFTYPALDELGLIGVGADHAGNSRAMPDRFQLALDAIATVSRRYHIDPRRVYVSGISGGGRSTSILTGCFPDVFTGAVPIVGMSWCDIVPNGVGKYYPAGFARPDRERWDLWRQRPVAAITGPKDFNYREMASAVELMQRAGMKARFFDIPGMAHHAPSPQVFQRALEWVDAVYQEKRAKEEEAAKKLVAKAKAAKAPEARRKLLIQATKDGPWTEAAWEAADLLRSEEK